MARRSFPALDRASASMIGSALAFATMGALTHALKPRCDWLVVATARALMMVVVAAGLARLAGAPLAFWRPRALWVRSLAGSFSLVCNFYALSTLPVADAVTLMNVQPLWVVLLATILGRRSPGPAVALGVACGLLGVALIERPHLSGDRLAALVALLSSFTSAVAMMGLHRLRHLDTRAVVAHFSGVASLVGLAWLAVRGQPFSARIAEPTTLLMLLGVGVTGTLGQVLLTRAYSSGSPAKVSVVGLTQVIFALGFDLAIWGRELTPLGVLGFVLVLAPTTWLSIRSSRTSPGTPGGVQAEARAILPPEETPIAPGAAGDARRTP